MLRALGLIMLAAAGCFFSSPAVVSAQTTAGPGVPVSLRPCDRNGNEIQGPGYYVLSAQPGTTVQLYALVTNRDIHQAVISLVAVDATSGVYGGISYNLPQQHRTAVGSWMRLSRRTVSLAPGKAAIVPFTVAVPRKPSPGQHIGGLTAFVPVARTTGKGGSTGLQVQTRAVTAVQITVPGPLYGRFAITGVTVEHRPNAYYTVVKLRNSGTTLLQGHGHVWVYRVGKSKPVISSPLTIDPTVPGMPVNYPIRWTVNRPPRGQYR